MIHTSPLPPVEIPSTHLTPFVLRKADQLADKVAMIEGVTGRSYTYRQLADLTARTAGGLAARGFGKGQVLAAMLPNLPEYFMVFHGAATTGGTVTTINPTYGKEEIAFQLRDAGARFLTTISMFAEVAMAAAAECGIEEVFILGDPVEGTTPLTDLFGAKPYPDYAVVDPTEDIIVLPYSSGTTGLPKGVMLTHHNLVSNLAQAQHAIVIGEEDRVVAILPFFHIYGMQVLLNGVIHHGSTAVTLPRFDLPQFLGVLQDHRITHAYLVPPIVLALAKHPLVDSYDLSSLKVIFSGAAPLGAEVAEEAARRIGCEVVQGYGLTETSPITHATPPGRFKPGSIGVAVSNTEVRIVDPETGQDLGLDQDGELWIRGPQVMKGYLNNPQATAGTVDADGWLHTGDIGHVDADGHYFIVDRLKELIKYKGFQVAPAELEALLLTHPAVADAAVIGIPDEEAGEIPKAFVVLKPGATATDQELMDHVAASVATYKQVRMVEFIEAVPKSASGKILRRQLRNP